MPLKVGFKNETLRYSNPFELARVVWRILKCESPDAVLIYGYYLWEHWLILFVARIARVPILFIGETFSLGSSRARMALKRAILPTLYRCMGAIIVIGVKNRAYYEKLGVQSPKLINARYCVDGAFFSPSPAQSNQARRTVRERYQIEPDAFVLLFVGRLFDRKRPRDVVEIQRRLQQVHPKLHTLMVGTGELESVLRQEALGISRITFTGFVDQAQIRDIYCASDCLIVPSEFETWGLVVNEAMHCGLPAVVTETCGAADDLVKRGETGFVYPVGGIEVAAQLVESLIVNPGLQALVAERARERVNGEFGVRQFALAIESAVKFVSRTAVARPG